MTTGADSARKVNILRELARARMPLGTTTHLARVHRHAVILVVHVRARDGNVRAGPNVEAVGVGGPRIIAIRVIDGDVLQGEIRRVVDAEHLHRRVLDVDAADRGVDQIVGVEELGLRLAAIAALVVPPATAVAVEIGAIRSRDGDVSPGDGDERSIPFLVAKGGFAFEDDLSMMSGGSNPREELT